LTLVSGLLYQAGVIGVQSMTPLAVAALLSGLVWTLNNIKRISNLAIAPLAILLFAAIILYYTIYTAPHLYQSFYWRSGFLPYTAPLVLSTWIFALITTQCLLDKPSRLIIILLAGLSFVAGGFSEAGSAYLATALSLYVIAAFVYRKQHWAKQSISSAGISLAFVILAMIMLVLSPTSGMRMARYGEPSSLLELPSLVLYFTYQFVRLSFLDLPLPHLALIVTFASLGYLLGPWFRVPLKARFIIAFILIVVCTALLLIAAGHAPSAYIEQNPPATRTRIIMRFVMLAAIATLACFGGMLLQKWFGSRWLYLAAVAAIIFTSIYALRTIIITGQKIDLYAYRAEVWDGRDQKIKQSIEQGHTEVNVRELDSLPVGGINDFKANEKHWINQCGERYYGVTAIRALSP